MPSDWSDDDDWEGELSLGEGAGTWGHAASPDTSQHRRGRGAQIQLPAETMQGRLEAQVQEAMKRHVATWDVRDVCNWVEVIGFPQYRRKFSHNRCVGSFAGRLLWLRLCLCLCLKSLCGVQAQRSTAWCDSYII